VAGQIAGTDWTPGVFKAPANAPMAWVQDVTVPLDDAMHGVLNDEGVDAIRAIPGRGIRIMGARTVSSDTDWRFINVRRLMMMIEKAILVSTQWAVFEPNDVHTRAKLRLSLTSFLIALWRRGALMGDTPAAGFYVTCDATNNPPEAVDQGRLLAEVGVAPSQPFEFVVLRVGRKDNEFQVTETGTG
jgi:phage tail sheath protein FI